MSAILQKVLPFAPWMQPNSRRLPGVQPVAIEDWLQIDDAYGAQMAQRVELLAARRDDVLRLSDSAANAALELLDIVLGCIEALGFGVSGSVTCPDGRVVAVNRADPLGVLGKIVQEDFCILQKRDDRHVLSGAILCFPAGWSLAEKFERPLDVIHQPVPAYDDQLGRRVERLFDAVRPGQPLMRANALRYSDANLYQPVRATSTGRAPGRADGSTDGHYDGHQDRQGDLIRSERQTLVRLPVSGAVVFSIHTYLLREHDLAPEQLAGLKAHPIERSYEA